MSGSQTRGPYLRREALAREGDTVREELTVEAGCAFFKGHFESFAIFPAVAQLQTLAIELAEECYPDLGPVRAAKRVKFLHPIRPGAKLQIALQRTGSRVSFKISANASLASEGVLEFEG